jgi:hypothetical protein
MLTLDGNFQLNLYQKRSRTDDRSLWDGHGYFPTEVELREYLKQCNESHEASHLSEILSSFSHRVNHRNRHAVT